MVGVLKSTGCANCRKRKKKCGEESPACKLCISSGRTCPGYAKRWKFVDANTHVKSQYDSSWYILEDTHQDTIAKDVPQLVQLDWTQSTIATPLISHNYQNASTFIWVLSDPQAQALFPLNSHGNFYYRIPARLGRNIALDNATTCLCSIYNNARHEFPTRNARILRQYGKALGALRACVVDSELRLEAETICASIVLQLCELMLNIDDGMWTQLMKGTKFLFQSRGPEGSRDPMVRQMLESQRAMFIVHDISLLQRSFLSEPDWREVLQSNHEIAKTPRERSLKMRSAFADILVDVPSLIEKTVDLCQRTGGTKTTGNAATIGMIEELYTSALGMHGRLSVWRATAFNFELDEITGAMQGLEPFPAQLQTNEIDDKALRYPDHLRAILDCTSSTVVIMLQTMMSKLKSIKPDIEIITAASEYQPLDQHTLCANNHRVIKYVKEQSGISAKPMMFGLKQLIVVEQLLNQLGSKELYNDAS